MFSLPTRCKINATSLLTSKLYDESWSMVKRMTKCYVLSPEYLIDLVVCSNVEEDNLIVRLNIDDPDITCDRK